MLVSAGLNLILHTWVQDNFETDIVYTPTVPSKITNVSWCHDNNYLAVLCNKGKPEILATRDKNNLKLVHTISPINDVTAISFQHTTKRCLGLGTNSGQVALYDTKNRALNKLFQNVPAAVKAVDFNSTDTCLAIACENGTIPIYAIDEGDTIGNYKLPSGSHPTVMCFHIEDPKVLAVASDGGEVILWDICVGKKIFFAQSHTSAVTGVTLTPCAKTLISVGQDHKMCVYDVNIAECVYRNSVQQPITAADLNHDGKTLAVGFKDGTISIYDLRFLIQPTHNISSHDTEINKLCFENKLPDIFGVQSTTVSEISFRSKNTNLSQKPGQNAKMEAEADAENEKMTSHRTCEEKLQLLQQHAGDTVSVQEIKKEVVKHFHSHISDLMNQLDEHVTKFKAFVTSEFNTVSSIMDEKWEMNNTVSVNNFVNETDSTETTETAADFAD